MPYELRVNGRPSETFDTSDAAVDRVRKLLADDPDCEPEIFDTTTGKAAEPASSKSWREHLANNVGF